VILHSGFFVLSLKFYLFPSFLASKIYSSNSLSKNIAFKKTPLVENNKGEIQNFKKVEISFTIFSFLELSLTRILKIQIVIQFFNFFYKTKSKM